MVAKGLRVVGVVSVSLLLMCFWHSLMHNFSRIYEALFIEAHYEYVGLSDQKYYKELSWKEKIFCLDEYANESVMEFLHNVEKSKAKRVLWDHRGKLTEEALFNGNHFIVKSGESKGFFRNLFSMGMAVNVWNNAHWARERGVPVLKPVALIEKRAWNKTKTFVVYLFEGKVCEKELKKSEDFFPKVQAIKNLLTEKKVIHHDFRLRNMVLLDDGTIQFIDIDKLHWYPRNSHVFRERLEREVRKFNENLIEMTGSSKRLQA